MAIARREKFSNSILMQAFRKLAHSWAIFVTFGALVLLSVGSAPPEMSREEASPEVHAVVEGNSRFAFELYSRLGTGNANQIVSPFSISSTLAMVYAGAQGNTEKQIAQVLHLSTNQAAAHLGMASLLNSFTNLSNEQVQLTVANTLWVQSGYTLTTNFLNLCQQNYQAHVSPADFLTAAERARQQINVWTERSTRGKITSLFTPGSLTSNTRLVIANAIYFKGKWASRFDRKTTHAKPFWVTPAETIEVPMMSQKSIFSHFADSDTQVLEMPCEGGRNSMLVLLPKDRDGLFGLEARLNLTNLVNWIEHLRPADVDVLLPRFKITSRFSLGPSLSAMGVSDAFDATLADFTGITPQRPLFVSTIEHAAMVEVDEEGTVAAAATGASFGCAQRPSPAAFHADHPFIFLILDKPTRTMLFMGKVTNPRS